jgi:pheromone a factor receptor
MALASVEILVVLPLNLFSIIVNLTASPLLPYTSWDDVHYNFPRVVYVTHFILQTNRKFYLEFMVARWAIPLSGFLFFFFFGLSVEARKDYSRAATYILGHLGIHIVPFSPSSTQRRSL